MASTIHFNGFTITVPTGELGEAMRQLTRFQQQGGKTVPSVGITQMTSQLDLSPVEQPKRTDKEITLDFLRAIEEFQVSGGGAPAGRIMLALGVLHAKGVGSRSAAVNKVLDSAGFAIPDVYTNPRDATGQRYWHAGPRLKDAIQALTAPAQETNVDDLL